MISQSQVEDWLKLASSSNLEVNPVIVASDIHLEFPNVAKSKFLKRFLIEIKIAVDRWDLVTSYFVTHPTLKPFLYETLGIELYVTKELVQLWGAQFLFHTDVPSNMIIGLSSLTPTNPKEIAIGKIDLTIIDRLNNLKAFW